MAAPKSLADIIGPPPSTTAKGGPSQNAAVNALLFKYPAYRQYLTTILQAAQDNKMDPAVLLSFLAFENGGADPNAASSANAKGLAQILDTSAAAKNAAGVPFFRSDRRISDADKTDPTFAIKYMAWRVGGLIRSGRSIHDAYAGPGGYNPGFTGDSRGGDPGALLTKHAPNYVPAVAASPPAKGAEAATTAAATRQFTKLETDQWVIRKSDGSIGFAKQLNAPRNAVIYQGSPLLRSQLQQDRARGGGYADTYFTYTGKQPSDAQIVGLMEKGVSIMGLSYQLAAQPAFRQSPAWKAHAPGIINYARSQGLIHQNESLSQDFVGKALVEGWDQATLDANLKARPQYLQSPAFQDTHAKLVNVYESIMGPLTPEARQLISRATTTGETADEFSAELRGSPAYTGSAERGNQRSDIQAAYEQAAGGPPNAAGRKLIAQAVEGRWNANRIQLAVEANKKLYSSTVTSTNAAADARAAYEQAAGGPPNAAGKKLIARAVAGKWDANRIQLAIEDNKKLYGATPQTGNDRASLVSAYSSVFGVAPDQKGEALIANALKQKWSPQRLQNYIRAQPNLYKQTNEYQGTTASLTDAYTQLFGVPPDEKGQKRIDAAAHKGWSPQQFVSSLRTQPVYLQSQTYKQAAAGLKDQYEGIFGVPDSAALLTIREAALQGWNPDQFAGYLRSQPAYTSSTEYQARGLAFLDAMGLISGETPVLKPGTPPSNPELPVAPPAHSPLIEGPPRGPAAIAGGPASGTKKAAPGPPSRPNMLTPTYGTA